MAIEEGGGVTIAYQEEVTWGVDPAGTPKAWRVTSKTINRQRSLLESREIGVGGQQPAGNHGREENVGRFEGELGREYQDDALRWMLNAPAWVNDDAGTGDHIDVTDAKEGLTVHKLYGTANKFRKFTGISCNAFEFQATGDPEANPLFTWDVLGLTGSDLTNTNPTPTSAATYDAYGPYQGSINIGGVTGFGDCTSIRLQGNWQYRTASALFSRPPRSVARGNLRLTGEMQLWFELADGPTIFGYGDTEQLVAVRFRLQSSGTVGHTFLLPAVKFRPPTDDPGQEGTFPVTMAFSCSPASCAALGGGSTVPSLMRIQRDYGA